MQGKYGMFGLKLNDNQSSFGLSANKSYFFFKNCVVCLGSNIRCSNPTRSAFTTLFQNNIGVISSDHAGNQPAPRAATPLTARVPSPLDQGSTEQESGAQTARGLTDTARHSSKATFVGSALVSDVPYKLSLPRFRQTKPTWVVDSQLTVSPTLSYFHDTAFATSLLVSLGC